MGGKLCRPGVPLSMQVPASRRVACFGPFELDLKAGELHRDGKVVRLQEQPFQVLKMLLENPGEVVTREELRRTLWPNDTVVAFDQSINAAIKKLRLALGDSVENPQYVETVGRRGYRLRVPVDWSQPTHGDPVIACAVELPQETATLIGSKVSHYRVLQVLGGGGMGVVYAAEDLKLGRRVALKFLPQELAGDAAAMQRFEREARAASALNHQNICTIYAVEEYEQQPVIVMELLEGRTLREVISDAAATVGSEAHPFDMKTLIDISIQIADGLEAAHQKGIIHRDIKPANIFVTNHGRVKILDFGLAKLHGGEPDGFEHHASTDPGSPRDWNPLLTLTRTGVTIGTAAYMSPEQVRGEKLDARTDLFSFGLVLFEMATGQRAFPGDTAPVLHDAILNRAPVPVRDINSRIPAQLENIVSRALEKDREARYQTAAEICADLKTLHRQSALKHLPRAWVVGLGVAAVIAFGTVLFMLKKAPKYVSVVPEIKLRQLTVNSTENPVGSGAISPDGKYLAYSDTQGLRLKLIDTGETRTVPRPEEFKDQNVKGEVTAWFPDSTRFMVNIHPSTEEWNDWSSATSSIWAFSVIGGAPTKLRDHALGCAVSPDGFAISFATTKRKLGEGEIWLMGPSGAQARKIYEAKEGAATDCWGWSPDGKHYLYVSRDESGRSGWSRPVEGGPPISLLGDAELSKMNDFVWLHDGRVVYDLPEPTNPRTCNYWTMRIDLSTGRQIEGSRRLTDWPNFCVFSGSVTNNDRRLAFVASSYVSTSYVSDLDAGGKLLRNIRRFTLEEDDTVRGWTADGKVMVAQNRDTWSLYKRSLDSNTPEPIVSSVAGGALLLGVTTPDDKWYLGPIWPDGESVERPTVPFPILRIPLAGGVPETILQLSRQGKVSCALRPSHICVLAEQSKGHKQMIVSILDPIKGRGTELARFDFDRELEEVPTCVISPDGTRLAMVPGPESPIEIRSLRGQLIRKIPSQSVRHLIGLNWTADQKGFFATRQAAPGVRELLYLDFRGKATLLRKCGSNDGGGCESLPSPDGRHLAIIDTDQNNNVWMMENF